MKQKKRPKGLSVIIPYYKGLNFIEINLNSLVNALKNNDFSFEIFVIIDCDTEINDIMFLNKISDNIIIIKNDYNLGVARTRNKGIEISNFSHLYFIDQDDYVNSLLFKKIINSILNHNCFHLTIMNGFFERINSKVKFYHIKPKFSFYHFLKKNKIQTPGQVIFNFNLLKGQINFIDNSEYKGTDDLACYLNIFKNDILLKYISEPILHYRLHENNYSRNIVEANKSTIYTLKNIELSNKFKLLVSYKIKFLTLECQKISEDKISYVKSIQYFFGVLFFKFSINKFISFLSKSNK
jgi:hypothetical protein